MTTRLEALVAVGAAPYEELVPLQIAALDEVFQQRRAELPVIDRLASEAGIDRIKSLEDIVPLLYAHTTYKSYPESFLAKGQWDRLTKWLNTLCIPDLGDVDLTGVANVDEWVAALERAGHIVVGSSGTSGKPSFMYVSKGERQKSVEDTATYVTMVTGVEARQDRPYFHLTPHRNPQRHAELGEAMSGAFGRHDATFFLTEERITWVDAIGIALIRKSIAKGTTSPSEIAAFEADSAARATRMDVALDALAKKMAEYRHEPCVMFAFGGAVYQLMLKMKALGVPEGDFHPETVMIWAGGSKGKDLPSDWYEQICCYFNLHPPFIQKLYGMSEGALALACPVGRYHVPTTTITLVLDEKGEVLLNQANSQVDGRFSFFNLVLDGRWGGAISGDKVTVDFGVCECGRPGPTVLDTVVRYSELGQGDDDKITCAGTTDSYVRGIADSDG